MRYNSVRVAGRDYTRPMRELLPEIIGKRSKTAAQVAKAVGRSRQTVDKLFGKLLMAGEIHIKRWTRCKTGPYTPAYLWGPGKNAPKPLPMSNSEKVRRYQMTERGKQVAMECRKRWRASENGQDYLRSQNKARWAREKLAKGGIAAIDPVLAAIMGLSSRKEG